ncbi:GntR family transcriptional regulator [Bariatricus sp. SGI.154]|uniref:GntR family transcriptional regulator n=1 Tax=Bariatricus sp. SGI.154 TaxID=3420549 RepID=UPI003D0342C3
MGKLSYKTLRENVVEEIRLKILNQELTPGMRIIEQDLSDELGVSRGPIREALRQLEQEGMIEYTRNVGCSVKEVTLEDIYEIYLIRSSYEILAVESYEGQFTDEEIAKMDAVLEAMKTLEEEDYEKVVYYDDMLHQIIVEKAGFGRLTKVWQDLSYGNYMSCYAGLGDRKAVTDRQYPIHKKVVDACRTRDVETIKQAITDHYMLTIRRLLKEGHADNESLEI